MTPVRLGDTYMLGGIDVPGPSTQLEPPFTPSVRLLLDDADSLEIATTLLTNIRLNRFSTKTRDTTAFPTTPWAQPARWSSLYIHRHVSIQLCCPTLPDPSYRWPPGISSIMNKSTDDTVPL